MKAAIVVLVALGMSCAGMRGQSGNGGDGRSAAVSEADYGRLGKPDLAVDQARQQEASARDELGQAKLHLIDDRHAGELARSDQDSAAAAVKRAAAEDKIGKDSLEPGQMERARDDASSAGLRKDAGDAYLGYANKLTASHQALVTAAERKVGLMQEKVNLAKLQALQQARVPAAGRYDGALAMERVLKSQRNYDQARSTASEAEQQTAAALEHWQDLRQRTDRGTGASNSR